MPETEQLPPQFNTDISKGPTWSALPAPYQPPVQSGPWDATQFIQAASRELPIAEATKAIESATQLEGVLGYDADIKAGVPTHDALTKWAPKLFFKHPAVALRAAAAQPQFKPSQVEVGGQSLIQMSPNRYSFAPHGPRTELTPSEQIHTISAEITGLQHIIDTGEGTDADKKRHRALLDELSHFRTQAPAKAAVKTNLKIGDVYKGHRYKGGNKADPNSWEKVS